MRIKAGTKRCKECGEVKPLADFSIDRTRCDGVRAKCKKCRFKQNYAWRQNNPEAYRKNCSRYYWKNKEKIAEAQRAAALKRNYGMTRDEYDQKLKAQGGACLVCGAKPKGRSLAVDHNHQTGWVRGLLCNPCNWLVAHAKDDPLRCISAAQYLEQYMGGGDNY
jgi:hypothetical protein